MSHFVWKNPYLLLNSVDLSADLTDVQVEYSADEVDDTTGGDSTHNVLPSALKNWTITASLQQDFAAGRVDATIFPLIGAAAVNVEVRPDTAARSATNPAYTAGCVVVKYGSSGKVGDAAKVTITIRPAVNGGTSPDLTRQTS